MRTITIVAAATIMLLGVGVEAAKAPVDMNGTGWAGGTVEKLVVKKAFKDTYGDTLGVAFGAGVWASLSGQGYSSQGTYTVSGTKVYITLDATGRSSMEGMLEDWIEEYAPFSVDVTLGAYAIVGKVKVKKGVFMAAKFKTKVTFSVSGGGESTTGKYMEKGALVYVP